jgi:hypothetical protein
MFRRAVRRPPAAGLAVGECPRTGDDMRALAMIGGGVAGGLLGYMAGYYAACELFDGGNLCGLLGVFVTGPLGVVGGGIGGWSLSRRLGGPDGAA